MKHIGIIITIVITLCGAAVGYGKLVSSNKTARERIEEVKSEAKEKVEEVKEKVEEHDDQIHELQTYDVQQSILIENSLKIIEKIEEKLEK